MFALRVGEWPPWSRLDETGLARYVTTSSRMWVAPALNRLDLGLADTEVLLEGIYDAFVNRRIDYSLEKFDPSNATQIIRPPAEVLERPREGTCLDLALAFAGVCLACELLPLVIVLEGHALVAVSLNHRLRQWQYRPNYETFAAGPLKDEATLRDLVRRGSYVAIECTGFSRLTAQPRAEDRAAPEYVGRNSQGYFDYRRAVAAGAEQLGVSDACEAADNASSRQATIHSWRPRPLRFGLDVAIAHHEWKIAPYPLPDRPMEREMAYRRRLSLAVIAVVILGALGYGAYVRLSRNFAAAANDLESRIVDEVAAGEIRETLTKYPADLRQELVRRLQWDLSQPTVGAAINDQEMMRVAARRSRAATIVALENPATGFAEVLKLGGRGPGTLEVQSRSYLIRDLATMRVELDQLETHLRSTDIAPGVRQLLILALGDYAAELLENRTTLIQLMGSRLEFDDDPGVHAACWWVLTTAMEESGRTVARQVFDRLRAQGSDRLKGKDPQQRHWFVHPPSGFTFVYLPRVSRFVMGDVDFERYRKAGLVASGQLSPIPHEVQIPRAFLISATETTESQFSQSEIPYPTSQPFGPDFGRAQVSWDHAALFCNWLTKDAGNKCYGCSWDGKPPIPAVLGVTPEGASPGAHLERDGFRLPTEAEWEYAARGGTESMFCFGVDTDMLPRYAWIRNYRDVVASLRPNQFGLFDVHGGLAEWCDDHPRPYEIVPRGQVVQDLGDKAASPNERTRRIIRGGEYQANLDTVRSLAVFSRASAEQRYPLKHVGFRVARTVKSFPP